VVTVESFDSGDVKNAQGSYTLPSGYSGASVSITLYPVMEGTGNVDLLVSFDPGSGANEITKAELSFYASLDDYKTDTTHSTAGYGKNGYGSGPDWTDFAGTNPETIPIAYTSLPSGNYVVKIDFFRGPAGSPVKVFRLLQAVSVRGGLTTETWDNGNQTLTWNTFGSSDANLSNLTVSAGALSPAFDAATVSYTVNVPYGTTAITLTGSKADPTATLKYQKNTDTPQSTGSFTGLVSGDVLKAKVTAQDGVTIRTYTVTVKAASLTSTGSSTADETALRSLISGAQDGDTLVISGDFNVSNTGSITITKNITIVSPPGETLTFHSECVDMAAFSVDSPGVLTLGGPGSGSIVLDGGAVWTGGTGTPAGGASNSNSARVTKNPLVLVTENGKFIMYDGVILQNNDATGDAGSRAGALRIRGGEVIINGGFIKNCQADKPSDSAGAIHITHVAPDSIPPSRLTINGGTIEGNKGDSAGSIFIEPSITSTTIFNWYDGDIQNNFPNSGLSHGSINITGTPTYDLHGNTAD
jgi:hypothetical protein